MNKIITTKDIREEITLIPNTEYAYIEIHTTIKGLTIYNGCIWGIQKIIFNEDGVIRAQTNGDSTAIILHNIRDIQIAEDATTRYVVNIEYNI